MTYKKHEIAVFIENEEMLREVGNKLTEHGERLEEIFFDELVFNEKSVVYYNVAYDEWCYYFGNHPTNETLITLPQLEEILKNQ